MKPPLAGVRVIELGFYVAAPAAAGLLADWGAEVIKIESPEGDPLRGFALTDDPTENPPFELDNRGKQSVCLNLRTDKGAAVARALIAGADVFITNLRPGALARLGLDHATLLEEYPSLVYAAATGYGPSGPDADRAAFDTGAYWSRAGVAQALVGTDNPPPLQRGGMGDHWAGMSLAAGVCAALFQRATSGQGQLVSTSLLRVGAYTISWDLSVALRTGAPAVQGTRDAPGNPLYNSYRTRDGRWICMLCLDLERHWDAASKALGLGQADLDALVSEAQPWEARSAALTRKLVHIFETKTASEWEQVLDDHQLWWAPVQSPTDLLNDPQAEHAGVFVDVRTSHGPRRSIAGPVDFSLAAGRTHGPAPTLGQHTRTVLQGLGYDELAVDALTSVGVVG